MGRMSEAERDSFAGFCRRATDRQIVEIELRERERAEHGDPYYVACHEVARADRERRGLDPPPPVAAEYTLDGEPVDLQEFLDDNPRDENPEVDPDEIRALAPGGVIFYGGGAQPRTIFRRVR